MFKRIMALLVVQYVLVLGLVVFIGMLELSGTNHLRSIVDDIYQHPFTVNRASMELGREILLMRHEVRDMFLFPEPERVKQSLRNLAELNVAAENNLKLIEGRFLGDRERVISIRHELAAWNAPVSRIAALAREGRGQQAEAVFYASTIAPFNEMSADIEYVQEFSRQRAEAYVAEAKNAAAGNSSRTERLLGIMVAVISITSFFVAHRVAVNIRRQERFEAMQKEHAEQLLAANNELESFSYSVSHDLRTPLRAIDGYSHMLLEDYAGKLDDEGRRQLTVVRENAQRMGQLIDDILQYSRARRLPMNMAQVNMKALAREVFDDIRGASDIGKLQVEIGQLPAAYGDRTMLRQVLFNLLSNAVKFTRSNPAPRITVGGAQEGHETVYFVRDNGVGFDMRYVDKLFGVFQRLHGVKEFEGTGIGLAMVKRIVARHGGRVWAEGRVNEGATIFFAIPLEGST